MVIKNTILSHKDAKLLEDVIIQYGRIVSFDQLKKVFKKEYSLAELKNRVSFLAKAGWLSRVKKGLYVVITDLGSLGTHDVSIYTLAQALNQDSYISFENALQHHGMFDQMLKTVSAITFQRARTYQVKETAIKFYRIKKKFYFGYKSERSDIGLVNMAEKEKALLDILYFRSDSYSAGLVWEKLKDHRKDFNFDLMKQYAQQLNFDVMRQIGFFLDGLGVSTEELEKHIQGKTSYSKMTSQSSAFNSKWRLYYERSIID